MVKGQDGEGHYPGDGSHEGRGQGGRRDVGGRAAGADQDRSQDGAAADAVDAADAADQAGQRDQDRGGNVTRRADGVCLPGRPGGGELHPERKQDGGHDQIEDLRAGDQFDADDRSGDHAGQGPAGEQQGQAAAGLTLPPVPV